MGAAEFILRIAVVTVLVLAVGLIAVMGFGSVVEPMYAAFGEPPTSLGWGEPGIRAVQASAAGFIGLLLVAIMYMVFAPIKNDVRQGVR